MTLNNTPQIPDEGAIEKAGLMDESPPHCIFQQFTIHNPWNTPLCSLCTMAFGLLFSGSSMITISMFPWDDLTFWEKPVILLIASGHGLFGICCLVGSIVMWAVPYRLIFDGKGGLILRSVVRARRIGIEDIKAVVLARRQNGEESVDAPDICTKFSRGKLKLSRFAECEQFLKTLRAVHPTVVIETV